MFHGKKIPTRARKRRDAREIEMYMNEIAGNTTRSQYKLEKLKERIAKISPPQDSGLWIMVTAKIPVSDPPPEGSIHWSVQWPNEKYVALQADSHGLTIDDLEDGESPDCFEDVLFGSNLKDPNWAKARKIVFDGEEIRLFSHEYSVVKEENLHAYVYSEEPSHVFRAGNTAEFVLIEKALETDDKLVYDAALVDGATHAQALATALGVDITTAGLEFPPIGWYEMVEEYKRIFF